jgi:hypothetical protein
LTLPPSHRNERPLAFEEYNGWINYPSWSVFTVMTSYYETYAALQAIADRGIPLAVKNFVMSHVDRWKHGSLTPHAEAAHTLVQDFVMNGIRRVEWTPVSNTLRGEQAELGEANRLTSLTYDLLKPTDWQGIVAGAHDLTQAGVQLRGWMEEQCLTWMGSPDARAQSGSVGRFATTVLATYFQAVQWEEVTAALKGE